MLALATFGALLLYLFPIAAFVAARMRKESATSDVALSIASGVAIDLLVILSLARVIRLEYAAFLSRAVETVALAAWLALRRERSEWPRAMDRRVVVSMLASAGLAFLLSLSLSRPYIIWDRYWHELLVPSLRAQTIPLSNVYDPFGKLPYHMSGDALAVTLQSLSACAMHSSRALSVAHDSMFAITGACIALLLADRGVKSGAFSCLVTTVCLFAGPSTVVHPPGQVPLSGVSYFNLYTLSYRPHVSLAGVLMLGIVAATIATGTRAHFRAKAPLLLALFTLLAVTDETSTGVVGLALGVTWLAAPDAIHPSRWRGLAILVAIPVLALVANAVFSGSFAPGAPRNPVAIVPWRFPATGPMPLNTLMAWIAFADDFGATVLELFATVVIAVRLGSSTTKAGAVFGAALFFTGIFPLLRLEIAHHPIETHRFMTSSVFLVPLLGALAIAEVGKRLRAGPPSIRIPSLALGLFALAASVATISTIEWRFAVAPTQCDRHESYFGAPDLYAYNCRAAAGARLGTRAQIAYVEAKVLYLYGGCNPVYVPSAAPGWWSIAVYGPLSADNQWVAIDNHWISPDKPIPAICAADGPTSDRVCDFARAQRDLCDEPQGGIRHCSITPEAKRRMPPPRLK